MKKVVVVGGGIAGLAAAYALQESKDIEYILVEKESRLGGKIITQYEDGFLIEGGPDCFLAEKQSVIKLAEKIGLGDSLIGTNDQFKGTYIYSGNKLHSLPEGLILMVPTKIIPFALSPLISWPGKLRMSLDFILPKKKNQDDETLHSFVMRRLGREALDKIAEPLIGGIHGGNPETMSLKASFPRFLEMEKNHGSLIRAMLAARKKVRKKAPNARGGKPRTYFMSFKKGMGELTDALEKKLRGRIIKGKEVTGLNFLGTGFQVQIGEDESIFADGVILAVPAPEAAALLNRTAPKAAETLRLTPMASSATFTLAYKKKQMPGMINSFGFLVPHVEGRKINAVTFSSVKWDYRVPNEEYVLIRAFIGGAKNSHLAVVPDDQMCLWVKEELRSILGITEEPERYWIHRWIDARPQYTMGHLERLGEINNDLKKVPGLVLAGGSYRGIGVPDCINDGVRAAKEVLDYLLGGN
ncbi:MAG: protoporphyrinogen oxidase [Bacillota bacterium]|jgi:oxygen-dependent protoporphyrinogen oxidase